MPKKPTLSRFGDVFPLSYIHYPCLLTYKWGIALVPITDFQIVIFARTFIIGRLYPKHISEIDADKRAKFGCNSSAIWKKEKFVKTLWWIHQFTYQFNNLKRPNDNLTKWHISEINADKRAKLGCNSSAIWKKKWRNLWKSFGEIINVSFYLTWPKRLNDNLRKWHISEVDADKRAKFGCNSSAIWKKERSLWKSSGEIINESFDLTN